MQKLFNIIQKRREIIFFVCLLGLAVFLSTYKLTETPPVWYDEGMYIQTAMNAARFGRQEIQVAPGEFVSAGTVTGGYTFIYPIAWMFQIFGTNLLVARAVAALFLIFFLIASYLLAKKIFGFPTACASSLLLVTFPVLYGNGRNVLGEVPGLLFLTLFLYAVHIIEQGNRDRKWYMLAGASAGLCVVTKPLFIVLLPAVVAALFLYRRRLTWRTAAVATAVIAAAVPFSLWLVMQFQPGDSLFSILHYYSNPYGITDVFSTIGGNFRRFVTELSPAYFFGLFMLWTVSLGVRVRQRRAIAFAETVAFFFSFLVTLAYLRTAGWYRYFFTANVLTLLFLPNALKVLWQAGAVRLRRVALFAGKHASAAVIGILTLVQGYQFIFYSWVGQYYNSTTTHDLQAYVAMQDWRDKSIFIYDSPELVVFLPQANYYQYLALTDNMQVGQEQLSYINMGVPDVIIIKSGLTEAIQSFRLYKVNDTVDRYSILEKI
jgi:hypothetical protein